MGGDIRVQHSRRGDDDHETASIESVVYFTMKVYLVAGDDQFILVDDHSDQPLAAKIGEADFLPAIELPLRHSKVGDTFLVRCNPKYAYGSIGRESIRGSPVIPPHAEVSYA